MISVEEWRNEENSGEECWNEEEGEASRFKSTQIDPNALEMNVYNNLNVARKDEGERARGQAGWLLESSSLVFLFSGIWVFWSRKGK